jgi:hypothetical protein
MPLIHQMRRLGLGRCRSRAFEPHELCPRDRRRPDCRWGGVRAYSLTFATYTFGLGLVRSLAGETLSVRFSAVEDVEWCRATAWATGTSPWR